MNRLLKLIAPCVAATILAAGVFFLSSCSRKDDGSPTYTGTTITQVEISAQLGYNLFADKYTATVYETVDYDWLTTRYRDIFWSRMFAEDITKWDPRANCSIFTEEYVGGLQRAYYRDHFHSNSKATRLAIGEFWYLPNPNDPSIAHSVVIALTNKGVIYLEPQSRSGSPQTLTLTDAQISSRFLRKI